jgi:Uncharacterized protein conserved in bacteria (DUF2188)
MAMERFKNGRSWNRRSDLRQEDTMPKTGDVHVVPTEKGWKVEVEGQSRAGGMHDKQEAAWQQARRIAKENKAEALLHGRDGKIRERNTYGSDPRRTRG